MFIENTPFQGTSVRPSGRLPSDRAKPCSSLELWIQAEVKARATRLLLLLLLLLLKFTD